MPGKDAKQSAPVFYPSLVLPNAKLHYLNCDVSLHHKTSSQTKYFFAKEVSEKQRAKTTTNKIF